MLRYSLKGLLEDGTNVIQADLQEHLGPDPFYFELDLIQPGVHSDLQVQEARKLSKDGDVCPEILDRQLDPVYLELRNIQKHVDVLTGGRLFLSAVVVGWWILSHCHSSLQLVGLLGRRLPSKGHDAPLRSPVRPSENASSTHSGE